MILTRTCKKIDPITRRSTQINLPQLNLPKSKPGSGFKSQMSKIGFAKTGGERIGGSGPRYLRLHQRRGERQSGLQKNHKSWDFPSHSGQHTGLPHRENEGHGGRLWKPKKKREGKRRGEVKSCDLIKVLCISDTVSTAQPLCCCSSGQGMLPASFPTITTS